MSTSAEESEPPKHYDVVVIGAGSGNTVIDERFDDRDVAIIEPGPMGGTCLNRGCIPSKMYVYPADVIAAAARGPELGARTSQDGADWPTLRERVIGRVDHIAASGHHHREERSNIDLLTGTARFTGPRALTVTLEDGDTRAITADQVVVAAGSRPMVPDIPGLHDVPHHTSDTIMRIEQLPARLAILGGGYVGCEFAHVFTSCGSDVVQLEATDRLLSNQDEEIARRFTDAARERWEVRLDTLATRFGTTDGGVRIDLSDGDSIEVDAVLVAIGRIPNGDTLNLAEAGVDVDDDGLVVVDAHQRTTADGVWALGDVCTHQPLKHVANHEARVVQHNLLHPDDLIESDHRFVPNAVFSHPPIASVGLTEAEARDRGIDVAVARAEFAQTAYGWAMQSGHDDESPAANGLVKLIADRSTHRLVGAHLIGAHASILIQPLIQAMSFDQDVRGLARGQYWIHPALAEAVEIALLELDD